MVTVTLSVARSPAFPMTGPFASFERSEPAFVA